MTTKKVILLLVFPVLFIGQLNAQDLSEMANIFLNTLTSDLKSQALFSLEDKERLNMNFIPIIRKGPTFHDFNEEQKQAAIKLLKASLSTGWRLKIQPSHLKDVN